MANFIASSVSVLLVPNLKGFHQSIKKELDSAGLAAAGKDIADDIANPLKKETAKAAESARKSIDTELGKAGKKTKLSLMKPFGDEGKRAGKKFASSVNNAIKTGIKVGGVAALVGGGLFLKDAIAEASDLEQSVGALESVFKENADQMQKYSEEAAQTMGLSKNEYNELATILGTQLKSGGFDGSELTSEVQNLTLLGADLSSMFGGTTPEAVSALSSALRGEMEPARRYGITLDQASIKNKALEMGLISAGEEMDANARTQATLAMITEQTADAQGNFARENDTLAGKTARAKAAFDNMKATVGEALLPALTGIMDVVNTKVMPALEDIAGGVESFVGIISDNMPIVATLVSTIIGVGVTAYIAGGGLTAMGGAAKTAFAAIGAGIRAIPVIGWIIAAIGLVTAGLIYFFTKTETGKKLWEKIWPKIKETVDKVVTWFKDTALPFLQKVWEKIVDGATWLWEKFKLIWRGVRLGVSAFIDWARENLVPRLKAVWEAVGQSAANLWNNHLKPAWEKIKNGISPVIEWIREAIGKLFGGGEAKSGVEKLAGNFKLITDVAKTVFNVLKGVFTGITWVLENILLPVFKVVFAAIGWVVTIAVEVISAVIKGLIWFWQNILAPVAMWLWKNVIVPVFNGIVGAVKIAIKVVTAIIQGLVWFWQNILSPILSWLWGVFKKVWEGIKIAVAIVITAITVYINLLKWYFTNVIAPVVMWLWKNVMKPVWEGIKTAIGAVVTWFKDVAWPLLSSVIDWIKTKFEQFKIGLGIIWNFIKNNVIKPVITWFQTVVWPIISLVIDWIKNKFEMFKLGLQIIWNFIKNNIINPVVAWFRDTVKPLIGRVIDSIKDKFENFKNNLKRIWDFVKNNVIKPVVNWFEDTVQPKIKTVAEAVTSAFETMRDNIGKAWDKVKSLVSAPIEFVVNTVLNKGIIETFNKVAEKLGISTRLPTIHYNSGSGNGSGTSRGGSGSRHTAAFKTGGITPGYSPGKDIHQFVSPTGGRLLLSGGEAIMRPEWTRAMGSGFVDTMNRIARTRGVQGVRDFMSGGPQQAFKNGGIVSWFKGIAGDTWDFIKDAAKNAYDFLDDPIGMFGKVADGLFSELPTAGVAFESARALPKKIIEGIKTSFEESEAAAGPAAGPVGPMPAGARRSLGYAQQVARSFGLTMTSSRRPGARTAGTGSKSFHALGRAMDFSNGVNTPQMMGFFNAMHPLKPTELLYSPAGGRQWRRWGVQQDTSGVTRRNHWNHVHVAFNRGGIMPYLHDNGGVLNPGLSFISNQSRKPEAILSDRQWETAHAAMNRQSSGSNITNNVYVRDTNATVGAIASEIDWTMRKANIQGRI